MSDLPFYAQSLLAGLFTFFLTSLGSSLIFIFKNTNKKFLDIMLGFAGGVMIAASFWSLLTPAIDRAEELGYISWLVSSIGFLTGGLFISLTSFILNKIDFKEKQYKDFKSSFLIASATTIHNIPEGLAVGVAFGSLACGVPGVTLTSALMLTLGIGIQNFPEGIAVSFPLKRSGMSSMKSFIYGSMSGIVEPIFCMIGFLLSTIVSIILPFLLAFSAGAMIIVVISELVPEASKENKNISTLGFILGFVIMMILDIALG